MRKNAKYACLLMILFSATTVFAGTATITFKSSFITKDTLPAGTANQTDENETKVFGKVEVEATFPGGEQGWREFLMSHLNPAVPVDKGAPAGKYMVIVQFIVDKDGAITDITPLTKYGFGMEQEVIRILRQSPKWEPAQQNGRTVKAYRKQPITFSVEEEKKKKRLF